MRRLGPDDEVENTGRQVRILIVQDHPLLASEIATVLEGEVDLKVVSVSRTGADALRAAAEHRPDVVLMDYWLPDMSGPAAAELISGANPAAAIVFHSAEDSEEALLDAVDAGATAYLTKQASAGEIVEAVRRAALGNSLIPVELFVRAIARQRNAATAGHERDRRLAEFTARELDVLNLLAIGLDTNQMSRQLGIAPHTVEWHVRHVIEKLKVHSMLQAVIAAARLGLIELASPQ